MSVEFSTSPWVGGTRALAYHGPMNCGGEAADATAVVVLVDRLLGELEAKAEALEANAVVGLQVTVTLAAVGYLVCVEGTPCKLERFQY